MLRDMDLADVAFVTRDILLQRQQQPLGMLGRKNHATLHTRLGHAGQHRREVDYELRCRVRYDREVGVVALRRRFVELDRRAPFSLSLP